MRLRLIALLGLCVTATVVGLGTWGMGHRMERAVVATSSNGRSVPAFLNSIDDPAHVARWRAGLDVMSEFSSYCKGMSPTDIVALFSLGAQKYKLPDKDGKFYYVFRLRLGDMRHLVSHLSHFPFAPDPLEFWIIVTALVSDVRLTEAKIIDKTAYP